MLRAAQRVHSGVRCSALPREQGSPSSSSWGAAGQQAQQAQQRSWAAHLRHDLELKLPRGAAPLAGGDVGCGGARGGQRQGRLTNELSGMGTDRLWQADGRRVALARGCSQHPGRQLLAGGPSWLSAEGGCPRISLPARPARSPGPGMFLLLGQSGLAPASKQYRRHCDGSLPTWAGRRVLGQGVG